MPLYRVTGISKESGRDSSLVIDALTELNAKAKAELQGIVVTSVVDARRGATAADVGIGTNDAIRR